MTSNEYNETKFGNLDVNKETTIEGCDPWPTKSFSQSNTFSNTFTQSNTYSHSNTYSQSNAFSKSNTLTMANDTVTYSLTIVHSFLLVTYLHNSFTLTMIGSDFTYVTTDFIYYDYSLIIFTTYFSFIHNFITVAPTASQQSGSGLSKGAVIGIICGGVVIVLVIIGIVIFVVKRGNANKRINLSTVEEAATSSYIENSVVVDQEVNKFVKEDNDQWI
ncbi:hypothetical protein GPJ56_008934 [Histomonas meleagridis]|uniref:uncharacterized protein n=1 Tax=Histomonas meleagridis TaxID=135588 RepID=UPI00355A30DA|nr:hypothetical protein GPJ56_008934 [Histomonas meleagridis]KAH0797860.1 hypothetical protein GO595_009489 [Histomonas meleagridis]